MNRVFEPFGLSQDVELIWNTLEISDKNVFGEVNRIISTNYESGYEAKLIHCFEEQLSVPLVSEQFRNISLGLRYVDYIFVILNSKNQ